MFHQLIKIIRSQNHYTQKDFATELAARNDEFRQIDLVTISRWERGVTTPNNAKALRVLRCFNNDVTEFLRGLVLEKGDENKQLDAYLTERFDSNSRKALLAALNALIPSNKDNFRHDRAFKKVNDPIVEKIRSYHTLFNQDRLDLFNLDLYLYQEEQKLHSYRFYEEGNEDEILGHSISFFFENKTIENEVKLNGCDVNLKRACRYKENSPMALYMTSGIITSEPLFRYHWVQQLKFLATHSNISEFYVYIMVESAAPFLLDIGFEVVATKNQIKQGGVKVGRRHYECCVLKIDTSILLTSKVALSLFRNEWLKNAT